MKAEGERERPTKNRREREGDCCLISHISWWFLRLVRGRKCGWGGCRTDIKGGRQRLAALAAAAAGGPWIQPSPRGGSSAQIEIEKEGEREKANTGLKRKQEIERSCGPEVGLGGGW